MHGEQKYSFRSHTTVLQGVQGLVGGQGAMGVVRKEVEERILFLLIKEITGFQTSYNNQRNGSVITYRGIFLYSVDGASRYNSC